MRAETAKEIDFNFDKLNQNDPIAKIKLNYKSINGRYVSIIYNIPTGNEAANKPTLKPTFNYY